MADKKVYAWAYKDYEDDFQVNSLKPIDNFHKEPLYSIEEVQCAIENNELPKHPVAWVYWNEDWREKFVSLEPVKASVLEEREHVVKVYSADELLAELQKEI